MTMSNPISRAGLKPEPSSSEALQIDAGRLEGSVFLTSGIKDLWVHDIMRPAEDFCARHHITPNQITIIGFALTLLGSICIATNHLVWGGWIIIWGGCCDFLDGRIARRMNLQTQSGAFFDSVLDRYMDATTLFSLAYLFRDSWVGVVVFAAILGSVTTPYIRAKAEALGLKNDGGQMQRPERVTYLGIGSMLSGYYGCLMFPFIKAGESTTPWILIFAVIVVAWNSNKVAIERFRETFFELKAKDKLNKSASNP